MKRKSRNITGKKPQKQRDLTFDRLRGIAVLLMVLTHTSGLFYVRSEGILDWFTWWGATVCFTMFLFVSGSVNGLIIRKGSASKRNQLKRNLRLLLTYFLTAVGLVLINNGVQAALPMIPEIVLLKYIPEFTEFILAFVLFGALILVIPDKSQKLLIDPRFMIPLSIVLFLLGSYWAKVDLGPASGSMIKALLVSDPDIHTFGLITYFPIFALGLLWGGYDMKNSKKRTSAMILGVSAFLVVFLQLLNLSEWQRWPPSILLFAYGVFFIFVLIKLFEYLQLPDLIDKCVTYVGRNALYYYIAHIIVLYIIRVLIAEIEFSAFPTFLIFLIVLAFVTSLNEQLVLTKKRFSPVK